MVLQVHRQDNVKYDGQKAKVVSNIGAYITVETEDGKRVSVPKDSALLKFENSDYETSEEEYRAYLENNQKAIKQYQRDWNNAKDQKWSFIKQIGNFWSNNGLTSGSYDRLTTAQRQEIDSLQDGKYDAISAMHRASNGVQSTVLDSLSAIYSHHYYG